MLKLDEDNKKSALAGLKISLGQFWNFLQLQIGLYHCVQRVELVKKNI